VKIENNCPFTLQLTKEQRCQVVVSLLGNCVWNIYNSERLGGCDFRRQKHTQINKNGKIYGKLIDFYEVLREVMPL
jgi:hypothetical protein